LFLFLLTFLHRRFRYGPRQIIDALEKTGRSLLDIGVITMTAGLVIGVLSLMGLGFTLSSILVKLSGGNAFLLLFLCAATSFVLGMGMPTTAAYVILAVLVVPALTQLGVVPLAAHLFLLFFAKASMITPPVCLAAYAAASIGRCDPMKTGWASTRQGTRAPTCGRASTTCSRSAANCSARRSSRPNPAESARPNSRGPSGDWSNSSDPRRCPASTSGPLPPPGRRCRPGRRIATRPRWLGGRLDA